MLFLLFDLSMLGYLAGPRVGAGVYNAGHGYLLPMVLLGVYAITSSAVAGVVALAWVFHIAVDRALGYGLKLEEGFRSTHLGRIGAG